MYVTLTIPKGTDKLQDAYDYAVGLIIGRWGGLTVTDGYGMWKNTGGRVITEPVRCLGVDTAQRAVNLSYVQHWFDNLAGHVADIGEQECVYYRIDEGSVPAFIGRRQLGNYQPSPTRLGG